VRPLTEAGSSMSCDPSLTDRAPSATAASYRFMAGEPMNAATKMLPGRLYSSCGGPHCCSTPDRSTATRSPIVIASTWSWVT